MHASPVHRAAPGRSNRLCDDSNSRRSFVAGVLPDRWLRDEGIVTPFRDCWKSRRSATYPFRESSRTFGTADVARSPRRLHGRRPSAEHRDRTFGQRSFHFPLAVIDDEKRSVMTTIASPSTDYRRARSVGSAAL